MSLGCSWVLFTSTHPHAGPSSPGTTCLTGSSLGTGYRSPSSTQGCAQDPGPGPPHSPSLGGQERVRTGQQRVRQPSSGRASGASGGPAMERGPASWHLLPRPPQHPVDSPRTHLVSIIQSLSPSWQPDALTGLGGIYSQKVNSEKKECPLGLQRTPTPYVMSVSHCHCRRRSGWLRTT